MRGNPPYNQVLPSSSGSIPARAGEPARTNPTLPAYRVYPRACGGTGYDVDPLARQFGLSPRVRGNRTVIYGVKVCIGSIPARAGEPRLNFPHQLATSRSIPARAGEPPGVAGSLLPLTYGSIPARAGEPSADAIGLEGNAGLSPRVRGNRAGHVVQHPRHVRGLSPRVRGNLSPAIAAPTNGVHGLSPRVRGNRHLCCGPCTKRRSIPARAGEPGDVWPPWHPKDGVYPRACGGTPT